MPENFTPDGDSANSFDEFLARYLAGERARNARSIDISRFLSRRTQELLAEAGRFALEHGHSELDALHVLRVMAVQEPASDAMRRIGVDPERVAEAAEQRLPAAGDEIHADGASITGPLQRALFHAYQVAQASGSTYIDPEHLFFALVIGRDAPAGRVLQAAGVTPESLTDAMRQSATVGGGEPAGQAAASTSDTPMLDQFGTDLTALARDGRLDPVIGRLDEIDQTVEILSRRTKNNPVLVGEAGVGKTAIVEGLARAIVAGDVPEQLQDKKVVSLDLAGMVAGTRYRGDFEERLTNLMDEISAGKDELIVFIDELHTVVGAGGSGESGGMDAGNILKPRLARGDLHLVGATTLKEYRRIEKDPALERRFQPVTVGEPSVDDAVLILDGLRGAYEEHHGVRYTEDALRAAVELSDRYISDRFLPDKAIDLIDQAGARLRLSLGKRVDTSALMERLATLESEKNSAVAAEHYEEASRLRDEIESVQRSLDELSSAPRVDAVVGEPEIAAIVSRATGIPVSRVGQADRERLARLESELHERVIGQDDAVVAVAKAVRRNRTGLGDEGRPVGSFLFLGPTGVGKTELAKSLATSLFGSEKAMLRFDMSEFGERHTVARLVGAPPGYVGYDEAGQLTERVRRNPYSVILFDEIEKAHPDVFNLLLQVLDDGRLTDGQGRTVDFRNTVVIMTSNLGSEFLASRSGALGFVPAGSDGFASEKDIRDRVMGKLREAMRPEFLNRIDEIVLFRKLDAEQLRDIVRLLLNATASRLSAREIAFEVTDAAVAWIAEAGYEPEYGARPLRRVIQREVDDRIAELMVSGELAEGGRVTVDADGELRVTAAATALPLAA
ncbi:ATP-dependent Clp protease ATP-binding subunit [Leifsonia sp. fls2-241-R2A-40a]|uniref:ATP-dependent Clp protease ATP-binding subunit n=1 Tax=Leifsonia sp. fls2-241-R2A-40a TaxID=3040290 RepID=UPI00254BCE64|nr:ATP-dependent Clp protease ATP-binding subunit [Leifsonia sp. fls2-241-R2A-40a]